MIPRPLFAVVLVGAGLIPFYTATAQQPQGPDPVELRLEDGPQQVMQFVMNRRARLGLKVNLRVRTTDSIGAYVDAVTPNGPAAKAGILSGDIITSVGGKSLLAGGSAEGGQRQSLPGLRLIELAAKLEPHDTIPVQFRRGKDRKTVSLVTADEPDILFQGGDPGGRTFAFRYGPDGPRRMVMPLEDEVEGQFGGAPFVYGSLLADLELAPLNPDLGHYFGATEGVLVVSVPPTSELGLKGGDVVLAVDGRKLATPAQLLRILRSYERNETLKLDVLRNHKRETITGRLGTREQH